MTSDRVLWICLLMIWSIYKGFLSSLFGHLAKLNLVIFFWSSWLASPTFGVTKLTKFFFQLYSWGLLLRPSLRICGFNSHWDIRRQWRLYLRRGSILGLSFYSNFWTETSLLQGFPSTKFAFHPPVRYACSQTRIIHCNIRYTRHGCMKILYVHSLMLNIRI